MLARCLDGAMISGTPRLTPFVPARVGEKARDTNFYVRLVSSPDVTPTSGSKNLAWCSDRSLVPRQSDPNTEARDLDYNVWCFSLGRGGVRVGPVRGGATG